MAARRSHVLAALGLVATAALVAAGCGNTSTHVAQPRPAAPQRSLADVVAGVRSGVVKVVANTCDGTSTGTGFLIGPNLVATVDHVVDGAVSVKLKRNGADLGEAKVIGSDSSRDLALLRTTVPVDGHIFRLAPRAPRLGEDVAALGFPLGLPLTVTRGTASGSGRSVLIDGATRRGLIQTDAAVNHGNSGGPLLSTKTGDVLGLVDLKETDASGIGFAVSARLAQPLLDAWRVSPQPVAAPSCAPPPAAEQSAAPAASPAPSEGDDAAAAEDAVYSYWSQLQLGQYRSAFQMLSPSEQAKLGGLEKWLEYYAGDPVKSVNVNLLPASVSGDSAYVTIDSLETVGAATGCKDWTGTYTLVRGGASGWLIDYATLNPSHC